MKKSYIAIILTAILCLTLLSFCGCDNEEKFTLAVTGDSDLLTEPLNDSYAAGETVTIKINSTNGVTIAAKVNGTPLSPVSKTENVSNTSWEFTFAMPNKNSTLELKTENTAIQTPTETKTPIEIQNTVAFYNLGFSSNREYAGFVMNAYVQSITMWEQIKPLIPNCTKNYDENFFKQKALLVLFGEKGHGGRCKIGSADVTLDGAKLCVSLLAEHNPDEGSAAVMTEWVVVLEIENNIGFTDFVVDAQL